MERVFAKDVPSAYALAYFGDIVGAPKKPNSGDIKPISGITAPTTPRFEIKLKAARALSSRGRS